MEAERRANIASTKNPLVVATKKCAFQVEPEMAHTRRNRKNNMMGGAKVPAVGTKAQVFHGTAKHTSGGLTKKDLMKTKKGRIVSRRKHAAGQKAIKKLRKLGYIAKKGKFSLFTKKSKRGGSASAPGVGAFLNMV